MALPVSTAMAAGCIPIEKDNQSTYDEYSQSFTFRPNFGCVLNQAGAKIDCAGVKNVMTENTGAQDSAKVSNEVHVLGCLVDGTFRYRKRGYEEIDRRFELAHHESGGFVPHAQCCSPASNTWSFLAFRPLWTFGYRPNDVSTFFEALPSDIRQLLKTIPKLTKDAISVPFHSLSDAEPSPEATDSMRSECLMWQSQSWCGFLQLFYDPDTGERTGVALNDEQARLFGMRREELLARFAAYDVPLLFVQQDLLLLFTDAVANGYADGEHFLRIIGPTGQPALVRVATKRSYNHAAQLIAVRFASGAGSRNTRGQRSIASRQQLETC
jgi:hypothetical protein